ncbi:MAG: hypothetical protein WEB93_08315, partial [Sphingomonadales bacterium]
MKRDLLIDHVGARGDGVALDGKARIYVPGTLAGEQVTASVNGERGRLLDVHSPSLDRTDPVCPHFSDCGGCSLQHMAAPALAAWKRQRVVDALAWQGLRDVDVG